MDNKELKKDKIIKNIIFDIGNVILNFNVDDVLQKFTSDRNEQKFILDNIINSPEWLENALIDTGYITRENAIEIVKDRTTINICDLLARIGFSNSKSEAKRMILGRGVKLDSVLIEDVNKSIKIKNEKVIQFGKNKFKKVIFK